MYFITQGSGYSAALDFSKERDSILLDLHHMNNFNGIVPKVRYSATTSRTRYTLENPPLPSTSSTSNRPPMVSPAA